MQAILRRSVRSFLLVVIWARAFEACGNAVRQRIAPAIANFILFFKAISLVSISACGRKAPESFGFGEQPEGWFALESDLAGVVATCLPADVGLRWIN